MQLVNRSVFLSLTSLFLSLWVSAQVVTGAGHCHGAAAEEAEGCGDSDDGQPLHLHPYLPT